MSTTATTGAQVWPLEDEVALLRAALAALVAVSPIIRHGSADCDCHYCRRSWWATRPEEVAHTPDCVWVAARRVLGLGEGQDGQQD